MEEALESAQTGEAEAKQERDVEVQVVAALKEVGSTGIRTRSVRFVDDGFGGGQKLADMKDELRSLEASHTALQDQLAAQREREDELARRDEIIADELEDLRAVREDLEADKRALEDELVRTEEKWEKERAEREREGKIWAGRVEDAERVQARAVDELEQVSAPPDPLMSVYRRIA